MERIVHLDFKGAPWKVSYLEKVILAAKAWGATGVLLEWEDTFPYSSGLEDIGSLSGAGGDGLYSTTEVQYILAFIKGNGLEPIQLVQTMGHMEFVLKYRPYQKLRELERSPAALCPSQPLSQDIVRMMLSQVLHQQTDARYIHIGADEVWYLGVCEQCRAKAASSKYGQASLYLEHVRNVALFLKEKRPDLKILMWDDMLRTISVDILKEHHLNELVVPVVWDYNTMEHFQIRPNMWNTYRQVFPEVWAGSAFKGANGSSQIVPVVERYVSNHAAWLREIRTNPHINFTGIILTGWSRYDHYATICELLPISLPSLASCLRLLVYGNTGKDLISDVLPVEQWPGQELALYVKGFAIHRDKCMAFLLGETITTWLNPWQIENEYTNPVQVDNLTLTSHHLLEEMKIFQRNITSHLSILTGKRSTEEWVKTFVDPIIQKLTEIFQIADARSKSAASSRPKIV